MILLVPIGPVPIYLISWLQDNLGGFLDRRVETGRAVPLPKDGYDSSRQQYKGEAVIKILQSCRQPGQAERIVGLIDQDCYSGELNFILGQAVSGGRETFVALPRLRPSCSGMEEDKALFRQRVLKEIIHELGHSWGLPHCGRPQCVMYFSNSVADTDEKNPEFCSECSEKLR